MRVALDGVLKMQDIMRKRNYAAENEDLEALEKRNIYHVRR